MSGEVEAAVAAGENEPKRTRRRTAGTAAVQGEIITADQQQAGDPQTPNALIAIAVQQDLAIEKLEKLLQLQREWDRENARKAFHVALSKFQSEIPPIVREDAGIVRHGMRKKYASLGTIAEAIRPWLYANGLSYRWTPEILPDGTIRVTCTVSHSLGHSETASLASPPVDLEKSTPIQRLAACITYLERYTLVCALGLSTVDDDDDGEGTAEAKEPALTPEQVRAKQLEMARAAAGQQPEQPAAEPQPTVTAPAPATPGSGRRLISQEQINETMRLCKELFTSGAEAFAEIKTLANIQEQADLPNVSEGVALAMLAELNCRVHRKRKAAADAKLAVADATPGTVTPEQREALRNLSIKFFDNNADSAARATTDWLRRLGLTTPRELSVAQAAARIDELKAELDKRSKLPF